MTRGFWLGAAGVITVLAVFAALFVIWDLLEQRFFQGLSTGLRHAILTLQAGIVTALAGAVVYQIMRRQQAQLSNTAKRITELLTAYQRDPSSCGRFSNPHLQRCRDVLDCDRSDCPVFETSPTRCWQTLALANAARDNVSPNVSIGQCHECEVYRRSCPDALIVLGEAFNNLMFLLERESQQLGQARAELLEKEKMAAIGQIAAGVADDIGNPLSSISSVIQILRRDPVATLPTDQLNLIEAHVQRISGTVRQLVRLARPTADRWERLSLEQVVADAAESILLDPRARSVSLQVDVQSPLPDTYALPNQLKQVLVNLAANALDAMPAGGSLSVRAQGQDGQTVITVEDTGNGISPRAGRRVFEPFFTTKAPGQGRGLGLAVSYCIVQRHKGTIGFSSSAGGGTLFSVALPVLQEPPEVEHGRSHHPACR